MARGTKFLREAMRILVVGGAGYIGAHMCKLLAEAGHSVTVFDNFSTGHRQAVKWGGLVEGELADAARLRDAVVGNRIEAIMHFAAISIVAESVVDPLPYYRNNFADVLTLLEVMRACDVRYFILSSSAAVYGEPKQDYIDEQHPLNPINPYGASKRMVEDLIADCARAYGLRAAALRYFNAAGADPSGCIGESHQPETHLIPKLLRLAAGESQEVCIFGDDYPTHDGTCIRDFVHVNDLSHAHLAALDYISTLPGAGFSAFNLGNGRGYSVRQVLSAVEQVVGRKLDVAVTRRRPGDAMRLVADSTKAQSVLNWRPAIQGIEEIVESAWKWHKCPLY
jgi:UDP-glucose 4-epimerase